MQEAPGFDQQAVPVQKNLGSVEFGGFSITHVERGMYSVDAEKEDLDEEAGRPPSLADSVDTEPEIMTEVEEESDGEDEEDQDSVEAIAKLYCGFQEKPRRGRERG